MLCPTRAVGALIDTGEECQEVGDADDDKVSEESYMDVRGLLFRDRFFITRLEIV